LTFFIIQFFSKTLFNLEKLSKLNRELKQQSLRKELALKTGTIGVWEWTFSTNRLVWDDMMYQIYGIEDKKQDSSYTMWSNAIDKEDKPKVEANLLNAKETNSEYNIQFWITTPSGERKYIHAIGHNEFDEKHKAYRMVGINKDITEFYRTQEQVILKAKELELANHALEASYNNLKQQKDEFEAIFKNSKDGIAITDLQLNFLDFNDAYLNMTGFSKDELLAKSCIELSASEDKERSKKALEIVMRDGHIENFEKSCIVKDGKRLFVNMAITFMPDKKRLVLVTKDVSSLKLLEEQSKLASMGEMIGNIAHQWRQPLSVISSASTGMQVQKEYGLLTDEKFNESCEAINKNAQYLSKTIDDFRNFIKGDRNKVVFDLNNEITSFLHLVEGSIKNHHINIILNLQNDIEILGYENELTQCFINIFNNAKDALKENIEENRVIFISTIKKGQNVIITIKDNAGGIPQDILPKIFEPYFTTKHQSQGTGLGLSMSYKLIVDGMGGTIVATNEEFEYNGKTYLGAELKITLPCN
jgi:PAS domain S-box-containing protein